MVVVEVFQDTEIFKSVELHSENGLEMTDHSMLKLGEETAGLLLRSHGTDLFEYIELYLG